MRVFVVGAGYVGLTTAVGFVQLGHDVTLQDVDEARVRTLAAGRSPIFEAGLEEALQAGLAAASLTVTTEAAPPNDVDMAFVCVPTPTGADGTLDMTLVESVVGRLAAAMAPDRTIVIRSTLPLDGPDRLLELISGRPGPALVVNPEFMQEGHALRDFTSPSRIAVGYLRESDRGAADRLAAVYSTLGAPLVLADARSIGLMKLVSNVFLALKVAFADELARLADALGADVSVVVDGIGLDPRIGRAFLDSGPGFGGSCLPEQAAAIAVEASRRGLAAPLLASIAVSNETHQDDLVESVARLLATGLSGSRIALLGLAFKARTDDVRHSPALALARRLRARGAVVVGFDPVATANAVRAEPQLETAASAAEAVGGADAVILATEWPEFASLDWAAMRASMRGDLVYDTRRIADGDMVRAAGLRYVALGKASVGR